MIVENEIVILLRELQTPLSVGSIYLAYSIAKGSTQTFQIDVSAEVAVPQQLVLVPKLAASARSAF
jgi:hypothetical protein